MQYISVRWMQSIWYRSSVNTRSVLCSKKQQFGEFHLQNKMLLEVSAKGWQHINLSFLCFLSTGRYRVIFILFKHLQEYSRFFWPPWPKHDKFVNMNDAFLVSLVFFCDKCLSFHLKVIFLKNSKDWKNKVHQLG